MNSHNEYRLILNALRRNIKSRGLTYATLAERVGFSEATIRRIFAGYECNIGRIFDLCDALELSFLDTVKTALVDRSATFCLTKEQEEYFASNPRDYGLFRMLLYGKTLQDIKNAWGISLREIRTILQSIERIGLIEAWSGESPILNVSGALEWRSDGPMVKKYLRARGHEVVDSAFDKYFHDKTFVHAAEVELTDVEIHNLLVELSAMVVKYCGKAASTRRIAPAAKRRSMGWLIAMTPYSTDWKAVK